MTDGAPNPGGRAGKPVRILFVTWGYSIHAVRRIRVFLEDPGFEVAVVSNHDYRFPGAKNIILSGEDARKDIRGETLAALEKIRGVAPRRGLRGLLPRLKEKFFAFSLLLPFFLRIGIRDVATFRSAANTLDVLFDVAIARADIGILRDAVSKFDPHVVFLQTLLYPCHLAYHLPRKYPVIVTFWNGDATWWAQWDGIDRTIKRGIVCRGAALASAMTVNSEHVRRALLDIGADGRKIHLVRYPGVDLERFAPGPKGAARARLRITAGKVVFCPRGLGGYLNSDVIVESMPEVLGANPDTLFLFVSDAGSEEWEKHLERAQALGVERHLRRDGQVPWEEMPDYYRASDVMVSVSSNDSLPNCMLEAMACGTPVVIGDIPQLREWVEDGANGYRVPPRDAAALADRINGILAAPPVRIGEFARRNRTLVEREADSRKTGERIRQLVRENARKG